MRIKKKKKKKAEVKQSKKSCLEKTDFGQKIEENSLKSK